MQHQPTTAAPPEALPPGKFQAGLYPRAWWPRLLELAEAALAEVQSHPDATLITACEVVIALSDQHHQRPRALDLLAALKV